MQCDFVVFRRGRNPLNAFTAILGHSRWRWVRFTADETAATLVVRHHALFAALGGVPKEILYDNAKSVVIKRDAYCILYRPANQTMSELMSDSPSKQRRDLAHQQFLRQKVESARTSFAEGLFFTNEDVSLRMQAKRDLLMKRQDQQHGYHTRLQSLYPN